METEVSYQFLHRGPKGQGAPSIPHHESNLPDLSLVPSRVYSADFPGEEEGEALPSPAAEAEGEEEAFWRNCSEKRNQRFDRKQPAIQSAAEYAPGARWTDVM